MSDRLLGISPVVAVAGVASLVLSVALYAFGVGAWLPKNGIGSSEAESRARAFASANGVDVSHSGAIIRPTWVESVNFDPVVQKIGLDGLRASARTGDLPVPEWRVDFRKRLWTEQIENDSGGFTVTLAGNGTVLGAEFYDFRPRGEKIVRPEARRIAEGQLLAMGIDTSGYVERGDAQKTTTAAVRTDDDSIQVDLDDDGDEGPDDQHRPAEPNAPAEPKSEHRFIFERPSPSWPELTVVIEARAGSNGIVEFEKRIGSQGMSALGTRSIVSQVIEGVAMVFGASLLVFILLGVLVFRLITRDVVNVWRALLVGLLFAASVSAYTIVTSAWTMPGVGVFFLQLLTSGSVGLLIIAAWLAGEADAYFAWGKSSTEGALALLTWRPHSRQVAREVMEGTLWGWVILAVIVIAGTVVALTLGPEHVLRRPAITSLNARPAWLFWVSLLPFVFVFSVFFLLFLPAWLHRLTRRTWIAVPLATIVAAPFASTFALADLRFDVMPGSISWGLFLSLACIVLVIRRGVLTATFAVFTFSAFYHGIAAVVAATTGDAITAGVGLALFLVPAVAALVAGPRLPEANVREAPPPRVSAVMDQARRHEELSIARRVQAGLLPSREPSVPGFDIAGTCLPANEVGGDYYDYFPFPDGRLGLAVGDVSGKGVPAAFCMTLTKGFMEVAAAEAHEPGEVLIAANGHLREYLARGTFVTMAYAVIDPEAFTIDYARAGHNPPAVLRRNGVPTLVTPSGTALGAANAEQFAALIASERLELQRGDAVVLYTDGVTEAMSASGELFGEDRLLETLARLHDGRTARDLADGLLAAVADHARNAEQHDDITVVVVRVSEGGIAA